MKMNRTNKIYEQLSFHKYLLLIILSIIIVACTSGVENDPDAVKFPATGEVSFREHIQPFLRLNCNYIGCHNGFEAAGGRIFDTYFDIIDQFANIGFVIPGNGNSSLFYQVVKGINPHLSNYNMRMPDSLVSNGVKRWIDAGAADN